MRRALVVVVFAALAAGCPYCDVGAIPCEGDGNCPTGAICRGGLCCADAPVSCACQQLQACDAFLAAEAGFTASDLAGINPGCVSSDDPECAEACERALETARNLVEGDLGPCE